jgi:hypothetical protein
MSELHTRGSRQSARTHARTVRQRRNTRQSGEEESRNSLAKMGPAAAGTVSGVSGLARMSTVDAADVRIVGVTPAAPLAGLASTTEKRVGGPVDRIGLAASSDSVPVVASQSQKAPKSVPPPIANEGVLAVPLPSRPEITTRSPAVRPVSG